MTQFPTSLSDNPVAQALSYGKLTVTLKSLKSSEHITIKATAKTKKETGGYAKAETLAEATHVFFNDAHDWTNKIGTYYPKNGRFYSADGASPVLVFVAEQVLQYATQGTHHAQVEIQTQVHCCRCGRELDDPVSIGRGFGPECYGLITGSKHVSRKARGAKANTPVPTPTAEAAPERLTQIENNYREAGYDDGEVGYYAHRDAARSDDR
jgi:hypothetical protein